MGYLLDGGCPPGHWDFYGEVAHALPPQIVLREGRLQDRARLLPQDRWLLSQACHRAGRAAGG